MTVGLPLPKIFKHRSRSLPSSPTPHCHLHESNSAWTLEMEPENHLVSGLGLTSNLPVQSSSCLRAPLDEPSDEEYERGQFAPLNDLLMAKDDDFLIDVRPSSSALNSYDELYIEIPEWQQPEEPIPELIIGLPRKHPSDRSEEDEPIAKRLRSKAALSESSNEDFAKRPAPYDKEKQRNREQQVVNPADISLGGEAVDWANKDVKEEEHSLKHSSPKGIQQSSSKEESSDDDTQQSKVLMHIPPPLTRSRGRPRKAESEKRRREAEARMKKMVEEGNDVRNMIDPSELHCICRQPFDDRKFYVACSECQQWFHGKCIGLSEKRARRLSRFVCHDCRSPQDEESEMEEAVREAKCGLMEQQGDSDEDEEQEGDVDVDAMSDDQMDRNEQYEQHDVHPKEEELYCLCRTPYDEEKFYVGCDNCTGWYHPECVGITERDAQRSESYICPGCQSGLQQHYDEQQFEHNAPRNSFLWDLFEAVSEHRNAWPFKEAVDVEEFPKYHQVVKNPIDLSIIENKLRNYCYSTHIELHADLQLMLSNAKLFNQKGSTIYQCAEAIEAVIKGKIAEARNRST